MGFLDNVATLAVVFVSLIGQELKYLFEPVGVWYAQHLPAILPWAQWLIEKDLLRRVAAIMCGFYCLSVLVLAFQYHASHARGDSKVKNFRRGYFTLLTVQIIPLMITGFTLNDGFIIWTRAMMLVTIVISYALVTTGDGTFNTFRYKAWTFIWITLTMLGSMSWMHDGFLREFVAHNEKLISWLIVITMVIFTIKGQWSLAVDLFQHFMAGDKTLKRFRSQFPRFFMLVLPIPHYWFAPSGAALVMGQDPILLAHVSGATGTFLVLVMSAFGFVVSLVRGTFRRKPRIQAASI